MANDLEFQIPHKDLVDNMAPGGKTITDVNIEKFKKQGLDFTDCNDATFEDDYSKGQRIVKVRGQRKSYVVPSLPWHND